MPAVTACLACRGLKAKCRRENIEESCLRCTRLGIECESIPRKLGRRLGSKNRPKSMSASASSPPLHSTPSSSKHPLISIRSPSPRRHKSIYQRDYGDESPRDGITRQPTPLSTHQHHQATSGGTQQFSNMLNVLAKVADEMPPNQVTNHQQNNHNPRYNRNNNNDNSPSTSLSPEITMTSSPYSIFERRKFLDMYRQASRSLDPDPYMGMAVLEEGLDLLLKGDPEERDTRILPGEEVVYSRVDGPRRDLLEEWDVLSNDLLSENEVEDLLEVYWTRCNPIIRLLDPSVYTLDYMRATSCLLLSVVLQVAAQCLPVSRHSASLVSRLDQHLDHLFAEIIKRGLQSLEICQALLIFSTYMRADKQHQTWQFVAQSIGMAIELRLDVNASPTWHTTEPIHSHLRSNVKRRNIQRFWMCLSDWDRRLAFIRGRRPLLRDTMLTSTASLRTWWCEPDALECDVMTCATISFRGPVGTVQRNIQRAMATHEPLSFEDHLADVDGEMEAWRADWYSKLSRDDQQRVEHDIRASRFVLLMTPYDNRLGNEGMPALARDECLVAALEVCKNAIPLLGGRELGLPIQNVTAARLYLLGYTSLCTLRIMDATSRTRDEPGPDMEEELFHLSILSSLSDRLCKLNVHQNISLIASVLGRRLLYACRKLVHRTLLRGENGNGAGNSVNPPQHQQQSIITNTVNSGFINNLNTNEIFINPSTEHSTITTSTTTSTLLGDFSNGLTNTLVPGDLEFSFDFSHLPNIGLGDFFPLFDNNNNNNDFGNIYNQL